MEATKNNESTLAERTAADGQEGRVVVVVCVCVGGGGGIYYTPAESLNIFKSELTQTRRPQGRIQDFRKGGSYMYKGGCSLC